MKRRNIKKYYIYSKERLMTKKDFYFYGPVIFCLGFMFALVICKFL